ncbi:beta strand repeat-containing protein [Herbaspirillum autotrophicum]|uniref:beta strand repeat-containing protein n=1 Tax=Herbaspirillum autotrophicum TaxID=180195 RepID=UPI0009FA70EB|nr:filamentous hemagglutinin N-terminal domain-containing protein [Herbaspirillum autotrophicum]
MNHFQRRSTQAKLALSPLKPLSIAILSAWCGMQVMPACALDAGALPTNGQISAGSGSISQSGNVMNVTQNSDRMVATWNTFNIGSAAQVNFLQPSSSSVALNRVTSSDASQIMGQLNANGQVYLINPSGILFGAGSAVNVGGLVASTLNMTDAGFMAGDNTFQLNGASGAVVNQGQITASDGGYVALLGNQVRNEGTIVARLGSVMLGAGEKITLDFNGDGLINMEVRDKSLNASVINQGLLQANGGMVVLSAQASDAMLSAVVNNEGVIEATSLQHRNGAILLSGGDSGGVAVNGTLNVSGRGTGESGGSVKLLGEYVGLFDGTRIDASGDVGGGTVLVGGNFQGSGSEQQAKAVYMGSDARIHADALRSGNGGKVILWSTESTRFYGDITVLGGGQTGSGGLVETSGHDLEVMGSVNLSAASGKGGTWLIDPYNINITSAANASGATTGNPFTSAGSASSNLSSATLNSSLSEGANVIVYTTSAGGTSGDINVLDDIKGIGNASLTLQAHRNIVMTNHSISNASGKTLNISLYSNYNNSGNGSVALSNGTITTNGGAITIGGGLDQSSGAASTILNSTAGVSLSNGSVLSSGGGNVTIRGAVAASAGNSNSSGVQISSASAIDAGGGNITIIADQASSTGTGDAFILTGGSRIVTNGAGSINIDSRNLGSGNGTRIYSTNNTIAASGSGNLTVSGNATSGFGILVCSTANTSTQTISAGSGNLTLQANTNGFAGSGRGLYLAASGNGAIIVNASAGGAVTLAGSSSGSYGTILNATGAGAVITVASAGNVTLSGNTSGGTTPALALISSGNGSTSTAGSKINVTSTAGNLTLNGNNSVVNTATGSFKAISLDAGGQYAAINLGTTTGAITLSGTSYSGRGVDIAPSAAGAVINIATGSGDITVNGNSTSSFGGYGIFLNSTGNAIGVNVTTGSGNITFNGDSVGTSDAIALGGNAFSIGSVNNIASQGGNITLNGNFHSPNAGELDHGIAILSVTNKITTTGNGNVTLTGNAADQGNGISLYGGGNALISVENGNLAMTGSSVYGNGIGIQTGINTIGATGSGSVSLNGTSGYASGISIYPSNNNSAATIFTRTGKLLMNGVSGSASAAPAISLRSSASGAGNGVKILSGSGDIEIVATTAGSGEAIAIIGSSTGAYNTISTGGSGNLKLTADSRGSYGVRFNGGTNNLLVVDGVLFITATAPNGTVFAQAADATTIAATGNGMVIKNFGSLISNLLTNPATASVTASLQSNQTDGSWIMPVTSGNEFSPVDERAGKFSIDMSLAAAPATIRDDTMNNQSTQGQDNDAR